MVSWRKQQEQNVEKIGKKRNRSINNEDDNISGKKGPKIPAETQKDGR